MKELYRTINPAEIALLKSVFAEAEIKVFVFDKGVSALGRV